MEMKGLFKVFCKQTFMVLWGTIGCIVLSIWGLLAIYPKIAKGNSLQMFLNKLPSSMLTALGMKGNIQNLNSYLNMNFFNSLFLYILIFLVAYLSWLLIIRNINNGSLVYYLTAKVSRGKLVFVQEIVFSVELLLTMFATYFSVICFKNLYHIENYFSSRDLLRSCCELFFIFFLLGSVNIFISLLINNTKTSFSLLVLIDIAEYILSMISSLVPNIHWLKYMSIFNLFNYNKISESLSFVVNTSGIMLLVSVVVLLLGMFLFKKRNLYI